MLALIIKCLTKSIIMTKADLVKNISDKTGMDKSDVQMIAEKFMNEVKNSLKNKFFKLGINNFKCSLISTLFRFSEVAYDSSKSYLSPGANETFKILCVVSH